MLNRLIDTDGKSAIVKVSPGEFYDRLTILEIKESFLTDKSQKARTKALREEWEVFGLISGQPLTSLDSDIKSLLEKLREVHKALWDLEEGIREVIKDVNELRDKDTDEETFTQLRDGVVDLYENICTNNDKRHALKATIDAYFNAEEYSEPKNYKGE